MRTAGRARSCTARISGGRCSCRRRGSKPGSRRSWAWTRSRTSPARTSWSIRTRLLAAGTRRAPSRRGRRAAISARRGESRVLDVEPSLISSSISSAPRAAARRHPAVAADQHRARGRGHPVRRRDGAGGVQQQMIRRALGVGAGSRARGRLVTSAIVTRSPRRTRHSRRSSRSAWHAPHEGWLNTSSSGRPPPSSPRSVCIAPAPVAQREGRRRGAAPDPRPQRAERQPRGRRRSARARRTAQARRRR